MRLIPTISWATIAITVYFGLNPFNFLSSNDVNLNLEDSTLDFNLSHLVQDNSDQQGFAYAEDTILLESEQTVSFSFEITPLKIPSGLGTICSLFDEHRTEILQIAQWKEHLVIRSRRNAPNGTRDYKEIGLKEGLPIGRSTQLIISSSTNGLQLFADAKLVLTQPDFSLIKIPSPQSAQLVIGNNSFATQPWIGKLKSLEVHQGSINPSTLAQDPIFYVRAQNAITHDNSNSDGFIIPKYPIPLKLGWLSPFNINSLKTPNLRGDIIINILGMIPIGLCSLFRFRTHFRSWIGALVLATATCFLISLSIESLQIFLPSRDSSSLDLVCNTIGGLLSAPIFICLKAFSATKA